MAKKMKNQRSVGPMDVAMGKRIRLLRTERKMSQSELAGKLGVTFQQVQKYEKGVNRVGASRLQQVANVLQVPVTDFYAPIDKAQTEMQDMLFSDPKFSLRLLRAYSALPSIPLRRRFVLLMETISGTATEEEEE